jgi:hypothetical protein
LLVLRVGIVLAISKAKQSGIDDDHNCKHSFDPQQENALSAARSRERSKLSVGDMGSCDTPLSEQQLAVRLAAWRWSNVDCIERVIDSSSLLLIRTTAPTLTQCTKSLCRML